VAKFLAQQATYCLLNKKKKGSHPLQDEDKRSNPKQHLVFHQFITINKPGYIH
jgi:hypothetical protein